MTYYPDLAEKSMIDYGPHIRTVGWLDDEHEFATGQPPADFVKKLRKLTRKCGKSIDALGWGVFMGGHTCQLCRQFETSLNLGVPADELLYVAPQMISHYVEKHSYLPPRQFVDAVLGSPIPGTLEYTRAVARFRDLHSETMEDPIDGKYMRAAFAAIRRGGDVAAVQDAAHRFCGSGKHIYGRIASIVADLDDRSEHAAELCRFMKACGMPRWQDLSPDFRWPVTVVQPIATPAENVWAAISMPGNLEHCHPFCTRNPVKEWPGEGSRDEVHYLSGWIYERRFKRWIDGVGYDLEIGRQGGETSLVSWRIAPIDYRNCTLRIAVYPHGLQHLPAAIRWLPHYLRLRPMLKKYLSSVVRGFEWYVIRGEPVPRDHFGRHPWFSASTRAG